MASQIDRYLLKKFGDGIDSISNTNIPLSTRLLELRILLEEHLESCPDDTSLRGELYYLNDVLPECQIPIDAVFDEIIILHLDMLKRGLIESKNSRQVSTRSTGGQCSGGSSGREDFLLQISEAGEAPDEVYGFEEEVAFLVDTLTQNERSVDFKARGIVGRAGVGKTTLCKVFCNQQEVRGYFLPRIWVSMSRNPGEDKDTRVATLERMLKQLGAEERVIKDSRSRQGSGGRLRELLVLLHQQLLGKRYLIVLDDAWDTDEWYRDLDYSSCGSGDDWGGRLSDGFPKGQGGTVIVTSCHEDAARNMVREENLQQLMPLQDDESCWLIFKDAAEKGGMQLKASNVVELREEIKHKCDGLPLAARLMGAIANAKLKRAAQGHTENNGQQQ